ncbi:MAG: hypothetical protein AB7O65_04745 [Candidatus Korobacteraceae bacterium]
MDFRPALLPQPRRTAAPRDAEDDLRRFSAVVGFIFCFLLVLSGCGNSTTGNAATPAKIQLNPATASLTYGAPQTLSAVVLDEDDAAIASATVTFTSSSPAVTLTTAAVSQGTWFATACAGTWNDTQLVCQPANTPQVVEITAASGSVTAKTTLYIHPKVDRVVVSPASVNCKTQGHTQQFSAKVFNGNTDITSAVGMVLWSSLAGQSVVTLDSDGIATASQPGRSSVFATVSGVTSQPSSFVTCPVGSVRIHVENSTDTSFSVESAGTKQLTAEVLDINGDTITAPLSWHSSEPRAATVTGTGLVTGTAGFSSITASCLPPACNRGFSGEYSNAVISQATGDVTSTVYAAGTDSTSLVPIDITTNSAGTAITLPYKPNSFVFSPQGDFAYMGSDQALMTLTVASGSVSEDTNLPGKVLAAALDGRVAIATAAKVTLASFDSLESFDIAGVTAAAFSIQNRAYLLAGNRLYIHTPGALSPGATPPSVPLPSAGTVVEFLETGALGFVGHSSGSISTISNCNSTLGTGETALPGAVALRQLPDGSGILALTPTGISMVKVNPAPPNPISGCPPSVNLTADNDNTFAAALTPRQLIVLPDGKKAYATSNQGQLQVYDIAGDTLSTIALAGGASAFTGGSLLNAAALYLGGSDNAVHRIDVASGQDAQQISVGFVPDLVVVKP